MMYPIRFDPIYQTYIWGGERIAKTFHRKVDLPRIAESWEISDRDEAMSRVVNGPLKGKTIHQLVETMKEDLLGKGRTFDRFPILTKIIDAKQNLSVQVHPDDLTAPLLDGEAKSEMWVMLDEGTIYANLKPEVDEKALKKAIRSKTVEQVLERLQVKEKDVIDIPGGRVHAIGAGSFLYEVQQNSNTTYRLYDWERGRELDLEKGFKAIRYDDRIPAVVEPRHLSSDLHHQLTILLSSPYFVVERLCVFDQQHVAPIPISFQLFFCLEGKAVLSVDKNEEPFEPGMTYLVPAAAHSIDFKGRCEALRIRLP